jgi:hypothetical protein
VFQRKLFERNSQTYAKSVKAPKNWTDPYEIGYYLEKRFKMAMQRKFSAEFKAKVLIELISGIDAIQQGILDQGSARSRLVTVCRGNSRRVMYGFTQIKS